MHDRKASIHYLSAGSAKRCGTVSTTGRPSPQRHGFWPFARGRSTSLAARRGDSDNDQSQHGAPRVPRTRALSIAEGRADSELSSRRTRVVLSMRPNVNPLNANFVTQSPKPVTSHQRRAIWNSSPWRFVKMATYVHDRRDGRSRDGEPGKRYRRKWGLQDCTLTIPKEGCCPRWTDGAGKSTLLRMAAGRINRVLTLQYSENHHFRSAT